MKKKIIITTTFLLGLGSLVSHSAGSAESLSNMNRKKEEVQQQLTETKTNIDLAEQEILRLQQEQSTMIQQMKRLELAMEANQAQIQETEKHIQQLSTEIELLQQEITMLQGKIEARHELLNERVKSLHENGGNVAYIDVLLGSSSFSNFIERAFAVTAIADADKQLIQQTQVNQQQLQSKQVKVEKKLEEMQHIKIELDEMMAQLMDQKLQKDEMMSQLTVAETEKVNVQLTLKEKETALAERAAAIDGEIKEELKRIEKEKEIKHQVVKDVQDIPLTYNGDASDVVTVGNRWIGNSAYVFGGGRNSYDIANGLFDCSAFVHWAYSQVGIKLGPLSSVSTETLKHVGTSVSVSDMKPGDLVFFDTYKKDGHVGIYVGNGKFIGSQSSTGVAIADMTKGYYKKKFNGRVKRI
ncbi:C40 family peptidase [Bacillus sp. CGMCC 1.16541]|uniref:C40 family peptidase n=1 Tax=Bacillus sp. CGMCC 1.16541 TaxID=2185143 RepID=UPI000D733792|nr:C40 family peptidase [Bacillus sp. CGMCC 1.16541]